MRTATLAISLLLAGWAAPALADPAAFGGPKMLIHGNYCGPGNNAPLPPIDALDAACARHDACTPRGGLPDHACNLRLMRDAEVIERDPRQPDELRALAGIVAAGSVLMPTKPDAAVATLPRPVTPLPAITLPATSLPAPLRTMAPSPALPADDAVPESTPDAE